MKKFTTIFIITIMAICLLVGCTNSGENTTPSTVVESVEPFNMEESELRDLYLKLYSEKIEDENFISDVEASIYKEYNLSIRNQEEGFISSYNQNYNEVRKYYFPIVLPNIDEVVIAYTNEYGNLCIYNATQDSHDSFRNIHVSEDTEFIDNCPNYSVVYTENSVQIWKFGKLMTETSVEVGSIYTGFSYWEGYIFRNGGEVYSVQIEEDEGEPKLVCEVIAHNVKEVIITDYKLNSDAWSQPLFLMEDGSIKAYCSWNGNQDAPRDDVSHLTSSYYEGGWETSKGN